jgi:hypothetical protein
MESLAPSGFLCLGSKESLQFSEYFPYFSPYIENEKIYQLNPGEKE